MKKELDRNITIPNSKYSGRVAVCSQASSIRLDSHNRIIELQMPENAVAYGLSCLAVKQARRFLGDEYKEIRPEAIAIAEKTAPYWRAKHELPHYEKELYELQNKLIQEAVNRLSDPITFDLGIEIMANAAVIDGYRLITTITNFSEDFHIINAAEGLGNATSGYNNSVDSCWPHIIDKLLAPIDLSAVAHGQGKLGDGEIHSWDGFNKPSSNPMKIVDLKRKIPCINTREIVSCSSGSQINRRAATKFVVTGDGRRLFRRLRPLPGNGTVLIDASGSMRLSDEDLHAICLALPAATIAYYFGYDTGRNRRVYGELHVFAKNGMRAEHHERTHGENCVDFFAIQWLMKQPTPRVLISDGGFSGGPLNQAEKAAKAIRAFERYGFVRWLRTHYSTPQEIINTMKGVKK